MLTRVGMMWRPVAPAAAAILAALALFTPSSVAHGHQGPPFPIVSDRPAGRYAISIWTDPDTTDDHSAEGKFWIVAHAPQGAAVPAGTRVALSVRPHGSARPGPRVPAPPVPNSPDQFFAAVELDQEGQWDVAASIDGPLGPATITASVEATFDLRPPFATTILYLLPFVAVGLIWARALFRRKRKAHARSVREHVLDADGVLPPG